MTRKPEILFLDPSVPDIPAILLGLRPEVEAILLDATRPAARQMSAALAHRGGGRGDSTRSTSSPMGAREK